ncbi:hypothetical protein BN1708_016320, partial [Verticillium longisporum]
MSSSTSDNDSAGERAPSKRNSPNKTVKVLGDLGVYCAGVKFGGFDTADAKEYNHIFSFMESSFEKHSRPKEAKQAMDRHNMRYLMRVYPDRYRYQSTNFDPLVYWRRGVQMAAMNWQTFDLGMQLNQAMFDSGTDRPWIDSEQPPALTETKVSTAEFPEADESAHFLYIFTLFSVFINNHSLYADFGFLLEHPIIIGFILFSDALSPMDTVVKLLMNILSRKYEFEADAFANKLGYNAELAKSLIKLQVQNLSTMDADWMYATYHFSHPHLSERLKALNWTSSEKVGADEPEVAKATGRDELAAVVEILLQPAQDELAEGAVAALLVDALEELFGAVPLLDAAEVHVDEVGGPAGEVVENVGGVDDGADASLGLGAQPAEEVGAAQDVEVDGDLVEEQDGPGADEAHGELDAAALAIADGVHAPGRVNVEDADELVAALGVGVAADGAQ